LRAGMSPLIRWMPFAPTTPLPRSARFSTNSWLLSRICEFHHSELSTFSCEMMYKRSHDQTQKNPFKFSPKFNNMYLFGSLQITFRTLLVSHLKSETPMAFAMDLSSLFISLSCCWHQTIQP
jgi:hypothetical protein